MPNLLAKISFLVEGAFSALSEDTVFYIKAKDANFKRIVRMIEKSKI